MKPVPYRGQALVRRTAALVSIDRRDAAPLYADTPGERPTWDSLPPGLRRWVEASVPASGGFDASYASEDNAPGLLAWGTLPHTVMLLDATRDPSRAKRDPGWVARATLVRDDHATVKRATLDAVPTAALQAGKGTDSPPSIADDVFTNLPARIQRALDQAVRRPHWTSGCVLYSWEPRLPDVVEVSQELWYVRRSDDWHVAGAYACRSMNSAHPHDQQSDIEAFVRSTQPWRTVTFRAKADWSYGASAAVTARGHSVLPLQRGHDGPALGQ